MLDQPGSGQRRLRRWWGRAGAWLLPPILATGAIVLQISLDVPHAPMLERDVAKPKTPRKSAAARNAERSNKAKAKTKKKNSKGSKQRNNQTARSRSARELGQLRELWSEKPLEDEPIDQDFRRRHEGLLRSVVTRARASVLAGVSPPPPPMQIRPACHTIRCDLELCGPASLVAGIAELLPGFTLIDQSLWQSLWHELREVEPAREPKPDQVCRRWIVDFAQDGGDVSKLAHPDLAAPARPARAPATPPALEPK